MKTPSRGAFTLVESLVVITIICMLVAMMLPGVMAVHEAARRATCRANLTQLGTALEEHVAAFGTLPAGTTEPKGPIHNVPHGQHISWIVPLLPYLDEIPTFRHIDQAAGAYDAKNAAARKIHISLLRCPSDALGRPQEIGTSNYAGCHNDVEAPIDADNHGVLFLNSHIGRGDVINGPAHTIYVGEKRIEPDDLGWMSGTRATLRNTGTPINWAPPQGAAGGAAVAPGDLAVGGFASCHFGGAHFLFGDGAVRFLSSEIDKAVFQHLGHRADGKLLSDDPTRDE